MLLNLGQAALAAANHASQQGSFPKPPLNGLDYETMALAHKFGAATPTELLALAAAGLYWNAYTIEQLDQELKEVFWYLPTPTRALRLKVRPH